MVKRMAYTRPPSRYVALFEKLAQAVPPLCPRLIQYVAAEDAWYAVFKYVDGHVPHSLDAAWDDIWDEAFIFLKRLRECPCPPLIDLQDEWIARLHEFDAWDAPAEHLKHRLFEALPRRPAVLTHGDFSPQNFLLTARGLMLLDWESIGQAPPGFDEGWMVALSCLGVTPGLTVAQLIERITASGICYDDLRWFQGLGLLRLLYRTHTLRIEEHLRPHLLSRIRAGIQEYIQP
jgi:aminoglycoside phosphotransferase (APT) family kinase protein